MNERRVLIMVGLVAAVTFAAGGMWLRSRTPSSPDWLKNKSLVEVDNDRVVWVGPVEELDDAFGPLFLRTQSTTLTVPGKEGGKADLESGEWSPAVRMEKIKRDSVDAQTFWSAGPLPLGTIVDSGDLMKVTNISYRIDSTLDAPSDRTAEGLFWFGLLEPKRPSK